MKTNAPELLAVEQCDRDAAAPLMRNNVVTWKDQYEAYVRKGEYDNSPLVQAFARHRIETRPALPDVAGLVSQGRAAVERLANLPLGCTLMEWSEISAPLLDALTALSRLPPRTGDDQVEAVLELRMDQTGRVEVGPDDPLYKAFRPSKEAVAAIEQNEAANAAALSAMRDMMVGHVENWPEPKKFSAVRPSAIFPDEGYGRCSASGGDGRSASRSQKPRQELSGDRHFVQGVISAISSRP